MDNLFLTVVVGLAVSIAGTLLSPRVQAWLQKQGNNRRTASLAALDKEEAESKKFHDSTDELVRYGLYHLADVFGVFLLLLSIDLVMLVHSTQVAGTTTVFGIDAVAADRIIVAFGSMLLLILLTARMFKVSLTLSNVYRFDTWTEYVRTRRLKLTKTAQQLP